MDGSGWKRVLLHWVNQTRFSQRTFYNLEQTDIEDFFEKFRDNITSYPVVQKDLILFLRDQYPEFEPHLDDDNHLSSVDYMYVYSLLLHFSCVKCPEEHFHKICQGLHENFQQAIAIFFKELLDKEILSKTNLRQAIASASPKSMIPSSSLDSPIKTPRNLRISPPTPKTNMLEERTRELNLLKAQLDTERYEKGLLEVQLKQHEDKIEKLVNLQKKNTAEIYELKNELLAKSTENNSPTKNIMDEQIKKRLRKEIAEKEEVILGLRENLESVEEEKILLAEKLSYSEKQVITCLEKIKEMDHMVNELKVEIEQKNITIQGLTETKNDLEQFIAETRSSPGYRSDLNMSAECLDTSLSRTTNSSGSMSSPENLGCSVIDIQLKEKEFENANLREEIENMKCDQSKLSKHVCDLIARYADVFEICNENLIANEEGTLSESFMVFENYVKSLVEKYQVSSKNVKHLNEETNLLQCENKNLCKRLSDIEENLLIFENQVNILKGEKETLEKGTKEIQSKCEVYIYDIEKLTNERNDLLDTIKTLKKEYEELKSQNQSSERSFSEQIKNLTFDLSEKCSEINKLELQNREMSSKITELLENVSNLEANLMQANDLQKVLGSKNADLENESSSLKVKVEELSNTLKHQEREEGILRDKHNDLIQEHEKLKSTYSDIQVRLEKMAENYKIETEKSKALEVEISDLNVKNADLINEINDLIVTNTSLEENHLRLQGEMSTLKGDISKKDGRIYELEELTESLRSKNKMLTVQYEEGKQAQALVIEKLRKDLKDCEKKFVNVSNELKNSLESVQRENKNLCKNITDKEDQCNELSTTISTLRSEKHSLEEYIKQIKQKLQEQIDLLTKSSESINEELYSLLHKLDVYIDEEMCSGSVSFLDQVFSDSAMNELKNKLNKLLNNNSELNNKNLELTSKVSELETQIDQVTSAKDNLIQKLNRSECETERLVAEIRNLEDCKRGYISQIEKFKANLNSAEKECNSLSGVNVELRSFTSVLEQELQHVVQENMDLLCKIADLESENEIIIQKSKELSVELDISKEELDKLKLSADSTAIALKQEISILKANQKSTEQEIMSLRKRCEDSSTKINNLEIVKNEHLCKIQSQFDTLQAKEEYISSLESENVHLKLKVEEMSTEISEMEKSHTQDLLEVNKKVRALENELQSIEESKLEMRIDFNKTQNALELARNELEHFKLKIDRLNKTNQDLKDDNEKMSEKLKSSEMEKENAEMMCATIKANLKQLEQERKQDEEKLLQSQEEISTLKHKVFDIVNQVKILNAEKDDLIKGNKNLNDELRISNEECKKKQEEIDELTSKTKALSEKIHSLKESLTSAESEVSQQQIICRDLQQELKNINAENIKLKENQIKLENTSSQSNKRLEKISIKLGDSQAKVIKLERENEAIKKDLESSKMIAENLQRENMRHLNENRSLADKISDLQKKYDEIISEKHKLEKGKTELEEQKEILHKSERHLKQDIEKLEESKKYVEAKVRRLTETLSEMTGALECAKSENISLDKKSAMFMLEIKELKKNLEESKQREQVQKVELETKCKEFSENINQARNENSNLRKANEQLQTERNGIREENLKLNNEISNLSNKLESLLEEHNNTKSELAELTDAVKKIRAEKENLEKENLTHLETLKQMELYQTEILREQNSYKFTTSEKIKELENLLDEKVCQLNELLDQIEKLESKEKSRKDGLSEKSEIIDELRCNLVAAENLYKEEKTLNENLKKDISIFTAKLYKNRQITEEKEKKWLEERNQLISEKKLAEERIKENRLELEGKLEKMKTKMKSIYNDEFTKIRSKHEREVGELRKELQALTVKNEKYESHVHKLSRQVLQLNDKIQGLEKENKFMEIKLKDYESCASGSRKHPPLSQMIGSDLRMEDEEGEEFNNTFLTDLKAGRISPFGRDSVSIQELQYRNSLAPPHLRSTYSAQYLDQHLREEDIKDGIPMNLDDSLSSLLYTGQRKKITGTTSYKRPGPPTPSKNAGRLSFGGCIDTHPREILKEVNDSGIMPSKKTTPNKLKSFFTSSKSRDEFSSPSERKFSLRKRKSFPRPLSAQFTSTPRKSRVHFDQRRQLDLFLNSSHNYDTDNDLVPQKECYMQAPAEKELEKNAQIFVGWRQPNINYATESESNSSFADKNDGKFEILPKKKNPKERRVSFFYRGNVYSRSKVPSKIIRDQIKIRAKNDRYANFNKFRKSLNDVHLRKSLLGVAAGNPSTDNYCTQICPTVRDLVCSNFIFDANNNDSEQFELLMKEKESHAPFEITEPNFLSSSSGSQCTIATSKTLYAGNVIVNRKIPHVNTTMAHKTSFYIIGNKNEKRVIRLATQTITLVDLCRMWGQMSSTTKFFLILCFCVLLAPLAFTFKRIF